MKNTVFEVFHINDEYVVYDPFINQISRITPEVYRYLSKVKENGNITGVEDLTFENQDECFISLTDQGFFVSDGFGDPSFCLSENQLKYYVKHRQSQMILELTKECNFRCRYCILSEIYDGKNQYDLGSMSYDTIRMCIDNFISCSSDSDELVLSFYGGEPLLCFDKICKSVEYIEKHAYGKRVRFSMTTNGSLLDKYKMEFFVKHKFYIMISLDGPQAIHDKNRLTVGAGGSFEIVKRNIDEFKQLHPDYFEDHVSLHAVVVFRKYRNEVIDFLSSEYKNRFSFSYVSEGYDEEKLKSLYNTGNDNANENENEKRFPDPIQKAFSEMRINPFYQSNVTDILDPIYARYFQLQPQKTGGNFWPTGTCIVGSRRLFATVQGELRPCEKVPYDSKYSIGTAKDGIDTEKVSAMVEEYRKSLYKCKTCWCVRFCSRCWINMSVGEEFCDSVRKDCKENMGNALSLLFDQPDIIRRFDKMEVS